jgi:diketogulonate reductase-like aldo/keto reductase
MKVGSPRVPMVNQVEFHPFIYEQQQQLLNYCYDNDIIVEAYSPLTRGTKLSNKVVRQIADIVGRSEAQVLLRWCIQQGTIPLPRSTNKNHICENFNVFDFELSAEAMQQLNSLSDGKRVTWDPEKMH